MRKIVHPAFEGAVCSMEARRCFHFTQQLLLTMKLTAIILLVACLQVSAGGYAQSITLSEKNAPLEKIFREIKKQTGYSFLYSSEVLRQSRKVDIEVRNATLEQVLSTCFDRQPLTWEIEDKTIIVKPKPVETKKEELLSAPPIDIKGRIVNENKEPVAGASVQVKGDKTRGVSTDASGFFELRGIDENAVLIISGVSIETREIKVSGKTDLSDVVVKIKVSEQEDIVVSVNTGYQKVNKARATGSFVSIDSSIINRGVEPNILTRIDGIAPGILFDNRRSMKLQIRGLYSLDEQTAAPLIILNNFPYAGDIKDINPNDIENITILRDAASASIWGAKAGNGVIVITTKNGQLNKSLSVSFNTSLKVSGKPNLFDLPILSTSEQVDLEQFYFDKGFFNAFLNTSYMPVPLVAQILNRNRLGVISDEYAKMQIDSLRNKDVRNDYLAYLYRKEKQQQYSINLSGGGPNNKYYVSLGYDKNIERIITNMNDRVTIMVGNTLMLSKRVHTTMNIGYTVNNIRTGPPLDYGSARLGSRALPLYSSLVDGSGNPNSIDMYYRGSFLDTLGQGNLLDWKYRPLQEAATADFNTKSKNLLANVSVQYQIFNNLSASVSYQYQNNISLVQNMKGLETYETRNLINSFTNLNATSPKDRYPIPIGGILDVTSGQLNAHNLRGQLNFFQNWASKHRVDAIAGGEVRQVISSSNSYRIYGHDQNTNFQSPVDYVNSYPSFYFRAHQNIPSGNRILETINRVVSLFGNASYAYLDRYILSASVRKDASNLFGINPNQKGRPFYSIGGSWKLSKEGFYDLGFLPHLNLRATYGTSGNININSSAYTTISYYPGEYNPIVGLPFAALALPANRDLRWEKVATFNIGVDYSFKNNRINGSIEYYTKRSTDVFGIKPIDPTSGATLATTNAANVSGNGLDIQINSKNIEFKEFKWRSTFNFSKSKYTVTKYLEKLVDRGLTSNGEIIFPIEGMNPYSVVSYKWGGLDSTLGNPLGYIDGLLNNSYSVLTQAPLKEMVIHGSAIPEIFGNFLNTFTWRSLSFSTNFTYKFKYWFRKQTVNYVSLATSGANHTDYLKRWQKPGDEKTTNVPSNIWPPNALRDRFYQFSEVTALKGDHIRWNDFQISYIITKSQIEAFPLQQLQFYGTVTNLNIIIWKANKEGIDPGNQNGRPPLGWVLGLRMNL